MNRKLLAFTVFILASAALLYSFNRIGTSSGEIQKNISSPRIVNIINFIRLLEPRDSNITEEVLYQTVAKQVEMMQKYNLGGTFLLQYDALLDPRYQKLLKRLPSGKFEIGGWFEIPQPLAENAGLKWRGDSPWDPRADVDFATGYTPREREKLVDVYMRDFKKIFGYYPKSVGSWFIDAHTLNYLYKKYGIVASCNCKDQIGTDGYTLWGGYWNQAYYPSLKNAYMPSQNEKNQVPVPIFRMLGSDPVRQYDEGIGTHRQGVVTLEPVYKFGGGDSAWVHWYFKQFVEGECMQYAYVQAGQENSFTWDAMSKGFEIQLPLIARLRDENKIKVETLAASGKWFRKHFKITPPTSVTVNEDIEGSDRKTVWFDSRFYRLNLLWENGSLRFRDIHLFDENFASDFLTKKSTSNQCSFFTLPFVDGHLWSSAGKMAGLRFKALVDGKEILLNGGNPVIKSPVSGRLDISWPLKSGNDTLQMHIDERKIEMVMAGKPLDWFLDLSNAADTRLPFKKIIANRIDCEFQGMKYSIYAIKGSFSKPSDSDVFRISPVGNKLVLDFGERNK
jgi:hypothetical protein